MLSLPAICIFSLLSFYQRSDAAPFDREMLAIAAIYQRHVVDIDHGFFRFSTSPGPVPKLLPKITRKDQGPETA